MTEAVGRGSVREVQIQATVLGPCRYCGVGVEFWSDSDCPHEPTFTRELGIVSRWHKNPVVRLWWRLTQRGR